MYNPRIVIFTGAGLSADSGIATYRGDGGVYKGAKTSDVMSVRTLRETPEIVHQMCDDRRVELGRAEPNAAHRMIAHLASLYGDRLVHITQNIDDLVERAGHAGSLHVHGNLTMMRSVGNSKITMDLGYRRYWSGTADEAPEEGYQFRCPKTGSLFRPDVVLYSNALYEEPAPLYPLAYRIMGGIHPDDMLVVIGTEGSVLPVSRWVRQSDCHRILNNLYESQDLYSGDFDVFLKEPAATAAEKILQIADDHMKRFTA
jgi:NAD-dependent deacetylase